MSVEEEMGNWLCATRATTMLFFAQLLINILQCFHFSSVYFFTALKIAATDWSSSKILSES